MSQCVVIVDPVSTGACVALDAQQRGYIVIAVWGRELSDEMRSHRPESAQDLKLYAEVQEQASIAATAEAVRRATSGMELLACIVGCESGVSLADALAQELGLLGNGTSVNRRDKSAQQRCVKSAGLRAVREAVGKEWAEVASFVEGEALPMIVKPVESAGSDGVKLCHTRPEVEAHFRLLMSAQRKVGSAEAAVLVQEFLRGTEYVVDHVSLHGEHKTVMVWKYDKRPCNGGQFVYFGMLPVEADSEVAQQIIPYVRGVLDALHIKHGATHGEVMMNETGPCLVEMNSRAHGGDGSWLPLAQALTGGYTQVSACIDAFLDPNAFAELPDQPPSPFKASGQCVDLVSMHSGVVTALSGYDRIRQLPSFVSLEPALKVGDRLEPTVDLFSQAGSLVLVHPDSTTLSKDIAAIRQMEIDGSLFALDMTEPEPFRACRGSDMNKQVGETLRTRSSFPMITKSDNSWKSPTRTVLLLLPLVLGVLVGTTAGRRIFVHA